MASILILASCVLPWVTLRGVGIDKEASIVLKPLLTGEMIVKARDLRTVHRLTVEPLAISIPDFFLLPLAAVLTYTGMALSWYCRFVRAGIVYLTCAALIIYVIWCFTVNLENVYMQFSHEFVGVEPVKTLASGLTLADIALALLILAAGVSFLEERRWKRELMELLSEETSLEQELLQR